MEATPNQAGNSPARLPDIGDLAIVFHRKVPHVANMRTVNRAMRDRQIAGEFDSVERLADRAKVSRSTASRFLAGKNSLLSVTLRILEALGVTFDQVFKEISPALLERVQADGMVSVKNGIVVVDAQILTWPEASQIREHLGLPALAADPIRHATAAGDRIGQPS